MIRMVNLWRKYKNADKRKQQALRTLFAGLAVFCVFYIVTRFFSIPLCPVKSLLGVDCPGCGMTRGVSCLLRLDFRSAWEYHIFSIPVSLGFVGYGILSVTDVLFDREYLKKIEKRLGNKYVILLFCLIYVLYLGWFFLSQ